MEKYLPWLILGGAAFFLYQTGTGGARVDYGFSGGGGIGNAPGSRGPYGASTYGVPEQQRQYQLGASKPSGEEIAGSVINRLIGEVPNIIDSGSRAYSNWKYWNA